MDFGKVKTDSKSADHYYIFSISPTTITTTMIILRTLARKFSNVDFFLRILPLKVDELVVMSEM